jgi:uncharacterized protein YjdB
MSEATLEATESEAYEATGEAYEGEGEAYEGEGAGDAYEAWGEDARSDARRRARQRQIMLARQRQAQLRRRPAPRPVPQRRPPVTTPAQAVTAVRSEVRSLDLDTKVALDTLRSRLDEANRLAYRNAWAAEASVAASQVLDSFKTGLDPHDWARAVIRGAPTLLLAPGKPRKPGLEGILFDPRVAGGALVAAIFAIGHFRSASQGVDSIRVSPPTITLDPGGKATLFATPVDRKGNPVANVPLTWDSADDTIAQLSATTGEKVTCTGQNTKPRVKNTVVSVSGGGAMGTITVIVSPAP